jgi:WD40 repeat protein
LIIGANYMNRLVLILLVAALGGCQHTAEVPQSPVQEIAWTGIDGFREWGQTSDGVFGMGTNLRLHTWRWNQATLVRDVDVQSPRLLHFCALPGDRYIACLNPMKSLAPWPLVLARVGSSEAIGEWFAPAGWCYRHTGVSRNRKFAAFTIGKEGSVGGPENKIGIVEIESRELRWVAELNEPEHGAVRQMAISNDGRRVAIGGWYNGVVIVDTASGKVNRVGPPAGGINLGYVEFSPEGDVLYVGDSGGSGVYSLASDTGQVRHVSYASETGDNVYGHRVSCLALSPDGAWIAAGTGPEGQVFLFSTKDRGAKPILLPHGHGTILMVSFSPNSTHLASVAGGVIKIWDAPAKASASQPSIETQPAATQSGPSK